MYNNLINNIILLNEIIKSIHIKTEKKKKKYET